MFWTHIDTIVFSSIILAFFGFIGIYFLWLKPKLIVFQEIMEFPAKFVKEYNMSVNAHKSAMTAMTIEPPKPLTQKEIKDIAQWFKSIKLKSNSV